jgi:geranylgeranyl diphosphate synthase type II
MSDIRPEGPSKAKAAKEGHVKSAKSVEKAFHIWRERTVKLVDDRLRIFLDRYTGTTLEVIDKVAKLLEAVEYTLMGGGKRLRALAALAACEAVGGDEKQAMPAAMSVEMIHAYSLIHDALPALDNDTMRRGRPTNHVVHGEATAILAGDLLQSLAFQVLLTESVSDEPTMPDEIALRRHKAAEFLSTDCGLVGLVGGQYLDLTMEGRPPGSPDMSSYLRDVCNMETLKTGSLISAAMTLGAILGGADDDAMAVLRGVGLAAGLAFQIKDDLLNASGDPTLMGKNVGTDAARGKVSIHAALGPAQAELVARLTLETALEQARPLRSRKLESLLRSLVDRDR